MTTPYFHVESSFAIHDYIRPRMKVQWTVEDLKREPMLFAMQGAMAWDKSIEGGPTEAFLDLVFDKLWTDTPMGEVIIDTRTHMLKPGWYPSIPGWHFDECPRANELVCTKCGHVEKIGSASGAFCRECGHGPVQKNDQPNISVDPAGQPEHLLCLVDIGTGSLTEFITGNIDPVVDWWDDMKPDDNVWGWCDRNISRANAPVDGQPNMMAYITHQLPTNAVASFGHGDFHRAVPATGDGWRLFMRATRFTRRKFFNEVRNQTQVYLSDPTKGW